MDIFYGRVTDNLAHVYVRVPRDGESDRRTVTGSIRGPLCNLSHTLPATIALRDMGPGPTLLGSAAVPDPCFWSTQLPALYHVHVELRDGDQGPVIDTFDQTIGMRRLGAAGRNLLWEGKRWVFRGVGEQPHATNSDAAIDSLVASYRDASAAMYITNPGESVCRSASHAGVIVIARLTEANNIEQQLRALARWGAVAAVVLPDDLEATAEELHTAAPNLLLAQHFDGDTEVRAAAWADVIVCRVNDPTRFPSSVATCQLPILAERRLAEETSVAEARVQCDRLQRDLAPGGDYAGYLVAQPDEVG